MRHHAIVQLAALMTVALPASAQEAFPAKPVHLVVPYSAGGPADVVARLISSPMSRELGQQVLVENVGGAGGTLGTARVAQAEADGYTLLLNHIGMATTPTLYRDLPYDVTTDFGYVGLVGDVPMVFVGRPDIELGTLEETIAWVKERGEEVLYAHAGVGSASHLCGLLFMKAVDAQVTTVPYQGTGPALTDLMGSQVDLMCDLTTNTTSQIANGSIKAFAVTVPGGVKSLPAVPSADTAGLDGFDIAAWYGLYVPDGTPDDVVHRLQSALQTAIQDESVISKLADLGAVPATLEDATPEALREKLQSEIGIWRPIIETAGDFAE